MFPVCKLVIASGLSVNCNSVSQWQVGSLLYQVASFNHDTETLVLFLYFRLIEYYGSISKKMEIGERKTDTHVLQEADMILDILKLVHVMGNIDDPQNLKFDFSHFHLFFFFSDPLSQADMFKMGLRVTGHTGEAKLKVHHKSMSCLFRISYSDVNSGSQQMSGGQVA